MLELSESDVARFHSYVAKGEPDACWECTKTKSHAGYAQFSVKGKAYAVGRVAYFLATGEDPGKRKVRRTCGNAPCLNPKHLVLGNRSDVGTGVRDKGRKGQTLTMPKATEIRRLAVEEKWSRDELAKKFEVGRTAIRSVLMNEKWVNPDYDPAILVTSLENAERIRGLAATGRYAPYELADLTGLSDNDIHLILKGKVHKREVSQGSSWHDGIEDPLPRPEDIERFNGYFTPLRQDECWLWEGGGTNGYGTFYFAGRPIQATRMACIIKYGHWGRGLDALHSCDRPICVNPSHLIYGTEHENAIQAMERERMGEVLNYDFAREIRRLYDTGGFSPRQLAVMFNASQSSINGVIRNEIWFDPEYHRDLATQEMSLKERNSDDLTWDIVREIRRLFETGEYTQTELCRMFSIKPPRMHNIVTGKTWVEPHKRMLG